MIYPKGKCPRCGENQELMVSNNPIVQPICFNCINKELNYDNIEHADLFCRSYNLPFKPDLWLKIAKATKEEAFKEYSTLFFDDKTIKNLVYNSTTTDVWKAANKEWEKVKTQAEILNKIATIKEGYIQRAALKWGSNYTFEEFIKLDSIYTATLKANNITNPLQREAVKMLCKIQIEINKAIVKGDTKDIKDYSSAYATFAKQAQLDEMIETTKTNEITTVAELVEFLEKNGYQFKFYDGADRDLVDKALKDMQETNRRAILEATGLSTLLENLARQKQETDEMAKTAEAVAKTPLESIEVDEEPETEPDSDLTDWDTDGE